MFGKPHSQGGNAPGRIGGSVQRLLVALMLLTSFGVGVGVDRFSGDRADAQSTLTDAPDYGVLEQTWNLIEQDYVAIDDVDESDLMYGAAAGMVDALGDTGHSRFMNPAEAKTFNESSEGQFVGIGIQLDYTTGQPVIAYPLDGSPAQKAGLRSHDIITEVNGTPTEGKTQEEVQALLLGKEGEAVDLVITRPSSGETLKFHIVRAVIDVANVTYAMLPNDVALIRISEFSTGVTNALKSAIRAVKRQGASSIILDLRDNPGGLVFEAIGVASQFIPEGKPIYLYKDKTDDARPVNTVANGLATDMDLVVLINNGSASSSEITAAGISDNDRGTLVGETTFGTGTVLTPYTLSDGSIVLLGTGLWLRPNGDAIWKVGMAPDIAVPLSSDADQIRPSEDKPSYTIDELKASTDAQLKAAYNEITGTTTFPASN